MKMSANEVDITFLRQFYGIIFIIILSFASKLLKLHVELRKWK